jgi:two-component system phosphate regulon sensor histidine kinase PhoR
MPQSSILEIIAAEMLTGAVALDCGGALVYANKFFITSFSPESLLDDIKGRVLAEFIGDKGLHKVVDDFLACDSECRGNSEHRKIEITEGERCFDVRIVPLDEDNDTSLMLFFKDITEEKMVEAIKRDFVANVSHELRTPLASIKGYSETLLDGAINDKDSARDFLKIIDKNATRMSRLIEDLLVLSRIESTQMLMVTEVIDLCELVRSMVDGLKIQARDKGIEITLAIADGVPGVIADKGRVEQVMVNLLDNAIKYTSEGGKVDVAVCVIEDEALVEVKDTGIGIPASDMPRIFERFYRVDKARSRDLGGTGLGLAIVKHIIQSLDGRVWVESEPGRGSTFNVALRLATAGATLNTQ